MSATLLPLSDMPRESDFQTPENRTIRGTRVGSENLFVCKAVFHVDELELKWC